MAIIKKLKAVKINQNHLLGIQDLSFSDVSHILNEAKTFINLNKSSSTQSANDFATLISKKISLPVSMWDERLSTSAVYNLSSSLDIKHSKIKEKIDQNAAAFILQGAIDYIRK